MKKIIFGILVLVGVTVIASFTSILIIGCTTDENQEEKKPSRPTITKQTDGTVDYHDDWYAVHVATIEIEGHKYVIASGYVGRGGTVSIIHSEACPCKEINHEEN